MGAKKVVEVVVLDALTGQEQGDTIDGDGLSFMINESGELTISNGLALYSLDDLMPGLPEPKNPGPYRLAVSVREVAS